MKNLFLISSLIVFFSCGGDSNGGGSGPDDESPTVPPEPIWVSYPAASDNDLSVLNGAPIHGIFYADHSLSWDFGGDPFAEGWTYELTITNRKTGQSTVLEVYNDYTLGLDELGEALGYTIENRKSNVPLPDPMFFSMSIQGIGGDNQRGPASDVLNFALLKNFFTFIYRSGDKVDSASVVGFGAGGAIGPSSTDQGADPNDTWNSPYFTGPYGLYVVNGQGPELGSNWQIKFWMLHPPQPFTHHWNDTLTWQFDDTMEPYVTDGFEYTTNYSSYGLGGGYVFGEYKNNPDGLQTGYTQVIGYHTYDIDGVYVDVLELSFQGLYTWTSADANYSKTISGSGQFVMVGD